MWLLETVADTLISSWQRDTIPRRNKNGPPADWCCYTVCTTPPKIFGFDLDLSNTSISNFFFTHFPVKSTLSQWWMNMISEAICIHLIIDFLKSKVYDLIVLNLFFLYLLQGLKYCFPNCDNHIVVKEPVALCAVFVTLLFLLKMLFWKLLIHPDWPRMKILKANSSGKLKVMSWWLFNVAKVTTTPWWSIFLLQKSAWAQGFRRVNCCHSLFASWISLLNLPIPKRIFVIFGKHWQSNSSGFCT